MPRPARGPRWGPCWRAGEGAGAPERARQATADRAPRGGCSALRVGRLLPLVCNDRLGGLEMHGGNYLHWLVTARVNSHLGELGPGDGFRPFRTKGDNGGGHRRRRLVHRVFMSWRFDWPDFPVLEPHSGCRASGRDGCYFAPPEVTPLIVVSQARCTPSSGELGTPSTSVFGCQSVLQVSQASGSHSLSIAKHGQSSVSHL